MQHCNDITYTHFQNTVDNIIESWSMRNILRTSQNVYQKYWNFIITGVISLDIQDFPHSDWKQKHQNVIVLLIL